MHSLIRLMVSMFLVTATVMLTSHGVPGDTISAQVFDGEGLVEGLNKAENEIDKTGVRTETDIIKSIADIINFILTFVAIIALIAFLTAGFLFILGFGSESSIQRAKKIMIWSAVGLLVILFSLVIVRFIVDFATTAS